MLPAQFRCTPEPALVAARAAKRWNAKLPMPFSARAPVSSRRQYRRARRRVRLPTAEERSQQNQTPVGIREIAISGVAHDAVDDWVITCKSVAEARAALAAATRILERLGVRLNPQKTRIVHIQQGFDFLGYRMVRTSGKSKLSRSMIQRWNPKGLIAYPTRKSIRRFRDRVRMLTRRSAQRKTAALIEELNPTLRGWAEYYGCVNPSV